MTVSEKDEKILQEQKMGRKAAKNKSQNIIGRNRIAKQLPKNGPMTAKQMLKKNHRSAGRPYSKSDKEEKAKQTRPHPTSEYSIQVREGFELYTIKGKLGRGNV